MSGELERYIREIPDFPRPGIVFKDISPLLGNGVAFRKSVEALAGIVEREQLRPDACAGPEARGFIFAAALAHRLETGLIPLRKPGKLPADTARVEYDLEYGKDAIEVHIDAITRGQRVLIVDDVLATGGTVAACAELVEKVGGKVVGCLFLLELGSLGGRRRLAGRSVHSLIDYP